MAIRLVLERKYTARPSIEIFLNTAAPLACEARLAAERWVGVQQLHSARTAAHARRHLALVAHERVVPQQFC